jgi:N-acetylmuramoyl-L-alanine amidase
MSISDQSIYNNYIARTLVKPSSREFSVGDIPQNVIEEIESFVAQSVKENDGTVPKNLYDNVADKISPYAGMDHGALKGLLKSSGIFGLVTDAASVTTVGTGLEKQRKLYNDKQLEITNRVSNQFTTSEEEGIINSMARSATGNSSTRGMQVSDNPAPDILGASRSGNINPASNTVGSDNISASGTSISSVEELEYEMGSTSRDISEIIVHWSDTFQNANLNGKDLDTLTGAGSGSYHFIIKRDGTVERGVPISSAGSHTPGHNSFSIGVCLVGGQRNPSPKYKTSITSTDITDTGADSLTRSQYNSLYQIFRVFFSQYPGGQALGHSEVDPTEDDPGFEIRDYVYNLFNKQSLYLAPESEGEKSPDEILQAIDEDGKTVNDKDNTLLDQKF